MHPAEAPPMAGRRRWLPGVVLAVIGAAAVLASVPLVGLIAVVALLALTPWGSTLATRVMVGLPVCVALGSLAQWLPGIVWSRAPMAALVVGAAAVQVMVALVVRPLVALRPSVPRADLISLVGAGLLMCMLGAPYLGRSADDVLLDLARGFDSVNHLQGVANLITERGASWVDPPWAAAAPGGSNVVMAGYPLGVHSVLAAALGLVGVASDRAELIVPFAWGMVAAIGLCAAVLGWLSARVAAAVGPPAHASARSGWAAAMLAGCLLLGGFVSSPFELGHAPFVVGIIVLVSVSWVACGARRSSPSRPRRSSPSRPRRSSPSRPADPLRSSDRRSSQSRPAGDPRPPTPSEALALLLAGSVALAGTYPPLLVGLAPAWALGLRAALPDSRASVRIGVVSLPVLLALALGLGWWSDWLGHLVVARGEISITMLLSVVLVVLVAAGVWVAHDRGWGQAPLRALLPAAGPIVAAVALAVLGRARGLDPGQAYYAAKLAEAGALASIPVACALLAAGIVGATASLAPGVRTPTRAALIAAVVLVAGLLPVGRAQGVLAGPGLMTQRLHEAARSAGQVRITEAARLAGPSDSEASAMLRPSGWFGKVALDDAPGDEWVREGVSASLWLAALRGLRTHGMDQAAACMMNQAGPETLPCLGRWLDAVDGRRLVLVSGPGPDLEDARAWAEVRPAGQVRVVELPAR